MAEYIDRAIAAKGLRMAHDYDGEAYINAIPAAPVMTKEKWVEKLRAALDKTHGVTEELRAYDGGSEAIKDE